MQYSKVYRYAKTDFAPAEWLIRSDRLPLQMQISLPHGVSLTEAQWSEHRSSANKQLLLSELESVQQLGNSCPPHTRRMRNGLSTCCWQFVVVVVPWLMACPFLLSPVSLLLSPFPSASSCVFLDVTSFPSERLQQMLQMSWQRLW